jgi:glycine cleavage system H protein
MTKYSNQNVFVRLDKNKKIAFIGISEFFVEELDVVEYISFPEIGELYGEDDFCTIDTVSDSFHFITPVSGEIIEINEDLQNDPTFLMEDPEFLSWVCKIKLSDKSELNDMMTFDEYRKFIDNKEEFYD